MFIPLSGWSLRQFFSAIVLAGIVLAVSLVFEQRQEECPPLRSCSDNVTVCGRKGLSYWPFSPYFSYPKIETLVMALNEITVLPNSDIKWNFPNLEVHDLRNNRFPCNSLHCFRFVKVFSECVTNDSKNGFIA